MRNMDTLTAKALRSVQRGNVLLLTGERPPARQAGRQDDTHLSWSLSKSHFTNLPQLSSPWDSLSHLSRAHIHTDSCRRLSTHIRRHIHTQRATHNHPQCSAHAHTAMLTHWLVAASLVPCPGTPLQNNMVELYGMLAFMYPDVFTTPGPFEAAFNLVKGTVGFLGFFGGGCLVLGVDFCGGGEGLRQPSTWSRERWVAAGLGFGGGGCFFKECLLCVNVWRKRGRRPSTCSRTWWVAAGKTHKHTVCGTHKYAHTPATPNCVHPTHTTG